MDVLRPKWLFFTVTKNAFLLFRRALLKFRRIKKQSIEEFQGRLRGTFALDKSNKLLIFWPKLNRDLWHGLESNSFIPEDVVNLYLNHYFDLLGSGWVQVKYGIKCRGFSEIKYDKRKYLIIDDNGTWLNARINRSNRILSKSIWRKLDSDYTPIDWQIDFKSGYRWRENKWASKLKYGNKKGVDVKVPWELARMQHLPQLALYAGNLKGNSQFVGKIAREIRNQILDFIATNPPGFGVNWICPMDISIRAVNICYTLDILNSQGYKLASDDENIITSSLYDHCHFVLNHLEWGESRGNHYLADICGLGIVATYLPPSEEINKWISFCIGQINAEIPRQFLHDGGNFEGSIAYHRLSLEMVLYFVATTIGLPQTRLEQIVNSSLDKFKYIEMVGGGIEKLKLYKNCILKDNSASFSPFTDQVVNRIQLAVNFFINLLKSDFTFPQVGDNDSGRFVKLEPVYDKVSVCDAKAKYSNLRNYKDLPDHEMYYFEVGLYGRHITHIAAALGFIENNDHYGTLEYEIVKSLTSSNKFYIQFVEMYNKMTTDRQSKFIFQKKLEEIEKYQHKETQSFKRVTLSNQGLPGNIHYSFNNFGIYLIKNRDFYLLIRCLTEDMVLSGHHHEDQLSIELEINNIPIIRDPGTFIYSALPQERNYYRSASVHFTPCDNHNGGIVLDSHIFKVLRSKFAVVSFFSNSGFAAEITNGSEKYGLIIHVDDVEIIVIRYNSNDSFSNFNKYHSNMVLYSPGYGILENPSTTSVNG